MLQCGLDETATRSISICMLHHLAFMHSESVKFAYVPSDHHVHSASMPRMTPLTSQGMIGMLTLEAGSTAGILVGYCDHS